MPSRRLYKAKSLLRDHQKDHDELNNQKRRKRELEDKVKQIKSRKENLATQFASLQNLNVKIQATLKEKEEKILQLNRKISETMNEEETVAKLKQFYKGVYGRLSDLCKPLDQRYYVAMTTVFGKHANAIVVDTEAKGIQCNNYLKEQERDLETYL